jgi:hypothetical protein
MKSKTVIRFVETDTKQVGLPLQANSGKSVHDWSEKVRYVGNR